MGQDKPKVPAGGEPSLTAPDSGRPGHARRFKSAGEANNELYQGFNAWSAGLGTHSVHAAYALIAANWAVHSGANAILGNRWAKWSLAVVIVFLGLNLLCIWLMTALYRRRCSYADEDKARWAGEFEDASAAGSPWPYTHTIECVGRFLEGLRILAPIAGGTLFILSLFL